MIAYGDLIAPQAPPRGAVRRVQAGGVGTVLGNGGGNETLRDLPPRLRRSGTMQVPAVVLSSSNASSRDK